MIKSAQKFILLAIAVICVLSGCALDDDTVQGYILQARNDFYDHSFSIYSEYGEALVGIFDRLSPGFQEKS